MSELKLVNRNFMMVVIGQIISLFGNSVLRFALPLYLLNQTHSAALFGVVTACSFIPMIVFQPIGGIVADRVNKRNIMVVLDFLTTTLSLLYLLFIGQMNLIVITIATLVVLYGIQGAYQPAVQAAVPVLVPKDKIMSATSVITLVNSLSGLLGPALGGVIYTVYGIKTLAVVSAVCFCVSAIMEIFIQIPFTKVQSSSSIFKIARTDMLDSIKYIKTEEAVIGKIALFIAAINLVFSALLVVGLPVIITQRLGFEEGFGNRLYSYCQSALAAGGLIGGICAGVFSNKLHINKSDIMIFMCSFSLVPIGAVLLFDFPSIVAYFVIVGFCFIMMIASTIFSIEMISYVQTVVPENLLGKIMALASCLCMCATPLGQAVYGWLFEILPGKEHIIFFVATAVSAIIAVLSHNSFKAISVEK